MTDSQRQDSDVKALVDERQRYVTWLEALEAKRESTPKHVYDRVHADYTERLRRVHEQLATRRRSMEEQRSTLTSSLSELEAEAQARADERAELDLRVHVGEVSGKDADDALRSLDEALAKIGKSKQALEHKLESLDALVKATPTDLPAHAPPPPDTATVAAPRPTGFDELAFLSSVVGEDGREVRPKAASATPARAAAVDAPQGEIFSKADVAAADASHPTVPSEPEAPPPPPPPRPAPAASRAIEQPASEQLLEASAHRSPDAEAPLAANVASNNPIVLKSSAPGDQPAKTLTCAECGAMNYPTEWYCERCGAELAAL